MVLDTTPFYGEGGGQAGDVGQLRAEAQNGADSGVSAAVTDTQRAAGGALTVHSVRLESGRLTTGQQVTLLHGPARSLHILHMELCIQFMHTCHISPQSAAAESTKSKRF